jgi:uncharacterized protein
MALTLFGLGLIGAFTSGLVGVGGAVVMIPLLLYVPPLLSVGALDIKIIAGLTMTQVLAAALVGAWSHGRHALVHRALAWTGGPAMAAGSLAGAVASRYVSSRGLLIVFALMATMALPLAFVSAAELDTIRGEQALRFNRTAAIALPATIGLVSGLIGAGGAFLAMPVLIGVMRIPVRLSIGTSLAMVGMAAAAGFAGKAVTGQVPLWEAVVLVLGTLAGAPLGGWVSRRVPVGALRAMLAAIIAIVMLRVWFDVFRF